MSDTVANLLSGLVGAIVGGVLSLVGSLVVNRRERRTALRHQLSLLAADLVPRMDEVPRPQLNDRHDDMAKQLDTMSRLGAIAGRDERRLTAEVFQQWLKARNATAREDLSDTTAHLVKADNALEELLELLQQRLN